MHDAIFITRRVLAILRENRAGHVLAAYARACNLLGGNGELFSVVTCQVGPGPLNIVIDRSARPDWQPGEPYLLDDSCLLIGRERIDLSAAELWECRPDWGYLHQQRSRIRTRLPVICRAVNLSLSPWRIRLPDPADQGGQIERDPLPALAQAQTLVLSLCALTETLGPQITRPATGAIPDAPSSRSLADGVEALCGLGPGSTPGGDDWLAGWLLGIRLFSPAFAGEAAAATLTAAASRTTTLSRALLVCAAEGEVDAPWQGLLAVLAADTPDEAGIDRWTTAITNHGATSGMLMLAGFLACC